MGDEFRSKVVSERARQLQKCSGPQHDDKHNYRDWLSFMTKRLGSIAQLGENFSFGSEVAMCGELVELAALAEAMHGSLVRNAQAATGKLPTLEQWVGEMSSDPSVMGGALCFPGSRLTVAHVGGSIFNGVDPQELLSDYPYLTPFDLDMASLWFEREEDRRVMYVDTTGVCKEDLPGFIAKAREEFCGFDVQPLNRKEDVFVGEEESIKLTEMETLGLVLLFGQNEVTLSGLIFTARLHVNLMDDTFDEQSFRDALESLTEHGLIEACFVNEVIAGFRATPTGKELLGKLKGEAS